MGGKHSPIELGKYFGIHETAMSRLEKDGYILPDGNGLSVERVNGGLLVEGRVRCIGGIFLDVTKLVAILEGDGETAMVQSRSYTYHVHLEGRGPLLRYCGPHDDEAHPGHKPFHHKHTYDLLRGDVEGSWAEVDPEKRPTLSEVIVEACSWYHEHMTEVDALRIA